MITSEMYLNDSDGVFLDSFISNGYGHLVDQFVTVNNTLSIDAEGLVRSSTTESFWVAHEGKEKAVISPNMLIQVNADVGSVQQVVFLPDEFVSMQTKNGLEGIAEVVINDDGDEGSPHSILIVGVQREWGGEVYPRIGMYHTGTKQWNFAFYPVDSVESPAGGWVEIADLSYDPVSGGVGSLLVLERDNKSGDEARIKRVYRTSLDPLLSLPSIGSSSPATPQIPVLEKELVLDLVPILESVYDDGVDGGGRVAVVEKTEGVALDADGNLWIVNDDDGGDGDRDPTLLLKVLSGDAR